MLIKRSNDILPSEITDETAYLKRRELLQMAGIATAMQARSPATQLFAVEPAGFDDTRRSLAAGRRLGIEAGHTSLCDAIVTPMPGELTFRINAQKEPLDLGVGRVHHRRP